MRSSASNLFVCLIALASPAIAAPASPAPTVLGVTVGAPFSLPQCGPLSGVDDYFARPECWQYFAGQAGSQTREIALPAKIKPPYVLPGVTAEVSDGVVVALSIQTAGIEWQAESLRDLKAKFGKPTLLTADHLQNRMGAKFTGVRASWKRASYVVEFDSTAVDIDHGLISITTVSYDKNRRLQLSSAPQL